MHIGSTDAQAYAASTLQELGDARARAKAEATRKEKLALRRLAQNAENPEFGIQGLSEEEEQEEEGQQEEAGQERHEQSGGSLNAKA
jgi:hypothetical protein